MSKRSKQSEALFEVWHVLLKFRWRFVLPAFLAAAAVLAIGMALPRKYRAEAAFERRTDMVLTEIMNRGAPRGMQDPRQSLSNEVLGDPALDELLEQLRPRLTEDGKNQFDRSALRADLKRKATVSYDISSNELDRVRVTYIGDEPELSRIIVNALVRNYIDRTRRQIEERLRHSAGFFADEAARCRGFIDKMEAQQLSFEIDHAELLPDHPNNIQSALTQIQHDHTNAVQKRDGLTGRLAALRKSLESTPRTTPSVVHAKNPELDRLEESLRQMEARYAEFTGVFKMKARHPDVLAIQQQIDGVREVIARTEKQVIVQTSHTNNPKHAELELLIAQTTSDLATAERHVGQLEKEVARLTEQSGNVFAVRSDYRKLTRQIEDAQRQLTFWEDNRRLVDIALAAETGDRGVRLAFIKECDPILRPVSPNLPQILLAAVLLSVIVGGVSVFYAHRTDESFGTTERLSETFNLPLFGAVSEIISTQQRRVRRLRNMIFFPLNTAVMAGVLIALTGILYLNLEKPRLHETLRKDPVKLLDGETGSQAPAAGDVPKSLSQAPRESLSIDREVRVDVRPADARSHPDRAPVRATDRAPTPAYPASRTALINR